MTGDDLPGLAIDDLELIDVASQLIGTRGRDPNHTVAAAARDADGAIHTGITLYHFTGGPCAELVALANAAAATDRPVVTMTAVGNHNRGVVSPCGRCRQVMLDYFPDLAVLVPSLNGIQRVAVRDLFTHAYVWIDQEP